MDDKKIAFIICVNQELYYQECVHYIEKLIVPEGFTIEIYAVRDANSIFSAYNQAMQYSDAKYKIYMHQDVFLLKKTLLKESVAFFQCHRQVGLLGLLGGTEIPKGRRFYKEWNCGNVIVCNDTKEFHNKLGAESTKGFAIDGMFMMTQYDVPWREDVLKGWDFYDFSESLEFQKSGYEVWVLQQHEPYSIHDCGYLKLIDYDERLDAFLRYYVEDFPDYTGCQRVYPVEYMQKYQIMMEYKRCWKELFKVSKWEMISQTFDKIPDERFWDTEVAVIQNIIKIWEKDAEFLKDCDTYEAAYEKYLKYKFSIWRKRYG